MLYLPATVFTNVYHIQTHPLYKAFLIGARVLFHNVNAYMHVDINHSESIPEWCL